MYVSVLKIETVFEYKLADSIDKKKLLYCMGSRCVITMKLNTLTDVPYQMKVGGTFVYVCENRSPRPFTCCPPRLSAQDKVCTRKT